MLLGQEMPPLCTVLLYCMIQASIVILQSIGISYFKKVRKQGWFVDILVVSHVRMNYGLNAH